MSLWSRIASGLAGLVRRRPPVAPPLELPLEHPPAGAAEVHGAGGPPWEPFDGGLPRIPVGRAELDQVYGDIKPKASASGVIAIDKRWERECMVTARNLPGYDKPLYVHRRVEPYLREALRRAAIACPEYKFQRVGCFCVRHSRNNPALPLSLHSWGVAIDIDAAHNQARTLKQRLEPWSPQWLALWPQSVPRGVVEAFESVGWEWGGRWFPFVDPMHFQLVWTRAPTSPTGSPPAPLPPKTGE